MKKTAMDTETTTAAPEAAQPEAAQPEAGPEAKAEAPEAQQGPAKTAQQIKAERSATLRAARKAGHAARAARVHKAGHAARAARVHKAKTAADATADAQAGARTGKASADAKAPEAGGKARKGKAGAKADAPEAEAPAKLTPAQAAALGAASRRARMASRKPSVQASNRLRVFKALSQAGAIGMSAGEIRSAIGMSKSNGAFGVIMRGEVSAKRVKAQKREEGTRYVLSALGQRHLDEGVVDEQAHALGLLAKGRAWERRDK
jgi:hypothetical protein